MKYSSDGTFPVTIVSGSSPVGRFNPDGSQNGVLASGLVPCGLHHPSGALNITVGVGVYAPDGSRYVSFNGTNYYIDLLGAGSHIDLAAAALIAAMTTPPAAARVTLINNLVVSLKASGAWQLMDCLYVLAAADNQAARLNWISPSTFTASSINSPTFTVDRGYAGDGSTSLLDSGFNPAINGSATQNSSHIALWDRLDNTIAGSSEVGNLNSSIQNKAGVTTSAISRSNSSTTATSTGLPSTVQSYYVANRNNGSTYDLWGAATKIAPAIVSASAAPSSLSYVMLGRQIAAGSYQFSPRQMSAFHWGSALTDAQITSAYSSILTYMQAVGAA